ncbi:MAG TPA: MarR family transcriptional regulator [Rhodanobacteraceae bacterium]|nr:MarR family transcriptional regulator [Rhodanobacteraceae bacterium]
MLVQDACRNYNCLDKYRRDSIIRGMNQAATPSDRSFQLCRLIGRVRAEFVNSLEHEMARQGVELNFSQFVALKLLGHEQPMTPVELARALHYNPGALTRLLDKLEQHGYLRRVPDPVDRRALRLELTPPGKSLRKRVIGYCDAVADRMFASTTSREREQLHAILSRVLDDIRDSGEQSPRD